MSSLKHYCYFLTPITKYQLHNNNYNAQGSEACPGFLKTEPD